MARKFIDLIKEYIVHVEEVFPWDVEEIQKETPQLLILDVREPAEFEAMHIANSLNVPRGILESACDFGYEETVPRLVKARDEPVIVVCRSGNRSVLAVHTMQLMGYRKAVSMKTGLRGWNDYELPLVDSTGEAVEIERADEFFTSRVTPEQMEP